MAIEFSERLYTLDVSEVKYHDVPRIIDPNEDLSNLSPKGFVRCYEPDSNQSMQLAFIIWRIATRERNLLYEQRRTPMYAEAEKLCTATRENLKSLLLPFVDGRATDAYDLCVNLLKTYESDIAKYQKGWRIITRPDSVWIDRNSKSMFLAPYNNGVAVGINPTKYIFVYNVWYHDHFIPIEKRFLRASVGFLFYKILIR